jgi:deoxyribonuclease V
VVSVVRPEFRPDPTLSRTEMETLQREVRAAATFVDDFGFDPAAVSCGSARRGSGGHDAALSGERPTVAGVDQAFLDDRAVSAVVVCRGGEVIERVHAVTDLDVPYVPGLLSFREGGSILAALSALETDPDVLLFDGSGRIHFREAGLATHVGVTVDRPSVGVAKSLLCGTPRESVAGGLPAGERVAVEADGSVESCEAGTVIGYAVQTRQYDSPNRHVNPLYVSSGHRVGAETAADLVLRCSSGYKLPEPTRLADSYADEVKADYE